MTSGVHLTLGCLLAPAQVVVTLWPLLSSPHWLSLLLMPLESPRFHVISASWVCLGRGEGLTFGLAHVQDFFLRVLDWFALWTGLE